MKENYTYNIGNQLKKLRKERFIEDSERFAYCKSQIAFAEKIGCKRETVINWENDKSSPCLDDFISICKLLECDPNYLFGVNSVVSEEVDYISQKMGISTLAVEKISGNDFLKKLLDYFLKSDKSSSIIAKLQEMFLVQKISPPILHSYFGDAFRNKLEDIFNKYSRDVFPLFDNWESFAEHLKKEIPYKSIKSTSEHQNRFEEFLKQSITNDLYNEIQAASVEYGVKTEEELYNVFIKYVADYSYNIFHENRAKEYRTIVIAQSISRLLDDFICDETLCRVYRK